MARPDVAGWTPPRSAGGATRCPGARLTVDPAPSPPGRATAVASRDGRTSSISRANLGFDAHPMPARVGGRVCRRVGPAGAGRLSGGRGSEKRGRMADEFMRAAIEEARQGAAEGGIPIGSVLVYRGRIIGRGHNQRVQRGSSILHGEMDALENAGRQPASVYREATLYTTLSPCPMCTGAILLYGIPKVVAGENQTFVGDEALLRSRGVVVEVLQDPICIELMARFIRTHPSLWNEDIGVPSE